MGKIIYIDDYLGVADCLHLHALDEPDDVFLDLLDETQIQALRDNKKEQAKILTVLAKKQIRPDKSKL